MKIKFIDDIVTDSKAIKHYYFNGNLFVTFFDLSDSYNDSAYISLITKDKKIKKYLNINDIDFEFLPVHYDDCDRKDKPEFIRRKEYKLFFKKVEETLNILYS